MPVIPCPERTSTAPVAVDAVWAANATQDQLYYPYVSSCVSVTLVFDNGLLGGHASQVTPDAQNPIIQPAQNLMDVINRMIPLAPALAVRGQFRRIYFIGTISDQAWDLDAATNAIVTQFGQPATADRGEFSLSPADIVFDTGNKQLYINVPAQVGATAQQTINAVTASGAASSYI